MCVCVCMKERIISLCVSGCVHTHKATPLIYTHTGKWCGPGGSNTIPLPTTLLDGFEGGVGANWAEVTGGGVGLGCNSLAPHAHGKHLYFSGCGTRQARTVDLDTRTAR